MPKGASTYHCKVWGVLNKFLICERAFKFGEHANKTKKGTLL